VKIYLYLTKNEVKSLKTKIEELEKIASENEKNLHDLEKVYKKIDMNKPSENKAAAKASEYLSNKFYLPKFPDLGILDRIRGDKLNFMESHQETADNKKTSSTELKVYKKQCEWFAEQKSTNADIEVRLIL